MIHDYHKNQASIYIYIIYILNIIHIIPVPWSCGYTWVSIGSRIKTPGCFKKIDFWWGSETRKWCDMCIHPDLVLPIWLSPMVTPKSLAGASWNHEFQVNPMSRNYFHRGERGESWGCYAWKFFVWPDKKTQKSPKDLKSFHVNRRARWNTFEQPADKPGRSCPMLAS